jgi:ketosteroid isomerase-like protein
LRPRPRADPFLVEVSTNSPPDIAPAELANRLAIRALVDTYAHCADRRDAEGQKALFTEDTHFLVYMEGEGSEPTQELNGREALTPVFDDLNRYDATTHFNGQSTVTLDGDRATGESYCLAHHRYAEDGERKVMVASLRYLDTFVKTGGTWLFAERKLYVDWTETRSSRP